MLFDEEPAHEEPAHEEPAHEEPALHPVAHAALAEVSAAHDTGAGEQPEAEHNESASAPSEPVSEQPGLPATESEPAQESPASEPGDTAEEPGMLQGWVPPPPEPSPVGAGWLGEALAATTPLAPADLDTLADIGLDPNDGVGALRLLSGLLRALSRRQLIDLGELAADIRESRTQGAAALAAAEHAAAATDAGHAAQPDPYTEAAEVPAEEEQNPPEA